MNVNASKDSKMALAMDKSPSTLERNDNKTRAGAISAWMTDPSDQRALSRLPTSIKNSITRDSWWRRLFCCCYRNSDEASAKELQDALKGLSLSLYELEYLNMTTSFTEPEIVLLAKQYHHLDINKDGVVCADELVQLPEFRRNPMKERLKEYFQAQNDGRSRFSMRQFITTLSVFSPRASIADKCRFLFNIYDCDGDGKIGKEDLRKILDMTLVSKMDATEIDAVVARTFQECAGDESTKLVGFLP
uniref:EF-hand domain-containing protein n=1 Tax=Lotharella globosa TaxID=91324 RepID=A0A7S3Z6C0_9EUKA|mmetsp:Transcript_10910/g.21583  ORF Transcript_10910/g.21583 Transcript_10910/m.21583 type:complete len:247 (-) Transcript_10910:774-1514(-)